MTPSPIRKVLSTMRLHQVQYLLMGGQACVFYGAAEFSRDADLAIMASAENLKRLSNALDELHAKCIAVPPFSADYLERGHAVHFRCQCPEAHGIRIDLMSAMRGVAPFDELWPRRTTLKTEDGEIYELLALSDLVRAKKTQRDRDWLMIRRLMEAHYFARRKESTRNQVRFWLCELRTALLLLETATAHPAVTEQLIKDRPLLQYAKEGKEDILNMELRREKEREQDLDRLYWLPLKHELEKLRHHSSR